MRDRLFRLAFRFLWNRADAEDAVQDAIASALAHSNQLLEGEKWWPWMCQIVVRKCRDAWRKKSRFDRHLKLLAQELPSLRADQGTDAETKQEVIECLNELPRRQREVLVLRHFEDMPYEDIAKVLSISSATARVHAQAGRERLMELMEKKRRVQSKPRVGGIES